MKPLTKILAVVAFFFIGFLAKPMHASAQGEAVSFQVFYDDLSPYGQWVDYGSYGYVWVPNVGAGFSPYGSNGYWASTDYGWTWVSDFDWGWAPFHYGRWDYVTPYGWLWIPDYTWGPAWVAWRSGGGYYGWAPMGPGISVDIVARGGYNPPSRRWCFVNEHHMGERLMGKYYERRSLNDNYIRSSSYIHNTYVDNSRHTTYISGPRREDVQKSTGRPVRVVKIEDRARPGHSVSGNTISTYRPRIEKTNGNNPRPNKVQDIKNVPPVKTRTGTIKGTNRPNRQTTQPQQQPRQQPQQNQPRQQPQQQPRQQPQQQPRQQPQQQPRQQPQQQPRQQPQQQPRQQPQQQPRQQPQQQPRQQPQQQPRQQPQQQPRQQPQQQPRQQPQNMPRGR